MSNQKKEVERMNVKRRIMIDAEINLDFNRIAQILAGMQANEQGTFFNTFAEEVMKMA